ncbi:lipopolysaccharide biosynthesis protein [uncultured Erythrobacter sp.]|uniref:lipopolysaccharide biosynthesis protein n=1 Tax=uncultured Erythrobacter sp. TaxID=263913 RepID=UPI00260BB4FA|nr:lipopolysaccharide biosynthesis protein [uncultured Erythrobacter sp.]
MAQGARRHALLRNTSFSFVQQSSAMVLAILLVPYMLWMLGPERYGLWLTLQLFNIIGLSYLAELGFQGAIVRFLARFEAEGDRAAFRGILSGGFYLFVLIGLVMAAGVIAFAQSGFVDLFPVPPAYREEMRLALTVIGAGLLIGFPGLVIKAYFAGRQQLATTKVWEFLDRLIFAAGVFVLLQTTTDLVALILFEQLLGLVLTIAFALVAWRGSGGWFSLRPGLSAQGHFRGLTRMSGPVFASNLVSQGFNRLPELFVSALLGPVMLTAYQLSTRIPRVIKTLQGSLNAAVLPHIAGLDAGGDVEEREGRRAGFAVKGLRANYLVATPLLVGAAVFAPVLLELWVGEQYRHLAGYMAAFSAFQGLFLASNYCSATLTRQEHFRLFVRVNLALVIAFVAALAIGLERWGLGFVFGALVISGAAMFVCTLIVFRLAHGVRIAALMRAALLGPVCLSSLLGAVLLGPAAAALSQQSWIIGAAALAIGGLLYTGALWRFVLTGAEREQLTVFLAKASRFGRKAHV